MSDENKSAVTESTTKELSNEVPAVATGDWFDQMNKGLLWLNERAWPISGFILFVSVLYLIGFIVEEKVPLSIASSSIIATLPVLFVLVIIFIVMLVGFLLSPTAMLFTAIRKTGKERLVDLLIKPGDDDGRSYIPNNIMAGWFFIPVVAVFFIGLVWFLFDNVNDMPVWIMNVLVLLSIPISIVFFIFWIIKEKSLKLNIRDISSDFWVSTCFSVLPQFLIITYVFSVSIRLTQSSGDSYFLLWFSVLIGVIVLCVIQFVGAKFIASAVQLEKSLVKSFRVGVIIVVLLGVYPPTASLLTGVAFQLTASGGRACAVLTWGSHNPSGVESVHGQDSPEQSKPLRILIQVDEYYLVRPIDKSEASNKIAKAVHFVPRTIVAGINDCQ